MGSGLSKLLLRWEIVAKDDDDTNQNLPPSVRKVLSNDDLVLEILLRLPTLSLHLFKRVCKQWLSLITSPSFTLTRTPDHPSGLFIRHCSPYSNEYHYGFVSFDPIIPTKRSIETLIRRGRIKQSCNGLLLCYIGTVMYYVCNPSISMFKSLPPIHDLYYERYGNEEMNIAFDPTKSPCYKVVHCGNVECDDYENDYIRIQTYSSETGVWVVSNDRFSNLWFNGFGHGIYWNAAIHWLSFYDPFHVIKLDIVDHPVLTNIQIPLSETAKEQVYDNRKLLKSHGSLLLLCKDDDSRHLNIYEMKNGCSVWSVKYFVNLDDMLRPYPTWKMPTNWRCRRHMFSVVLGERDEDSFFVIELSGKIFQYKFVLETLTELFDLGNANGERDCFEYIASFAHV